MKQKVIIEFEGPAESVGQAVDRFLTAVGQDMGAGLFSSFSINKKDITEELGNIQFPLVKKKKDWRDMDGRSNDQAGMGDRKVSGAEADG